MKIEKQLDLEGREQKKAQHHFLLLLPLSLSQTHEQQNATPRRHQGAGAAPVAAGALCCQRGPLFVVGRRASHGRRADRSQGSPALFFPSNRSYQRRTNLTRLTSLLSLSISPIYETVRRASSPRRWQERDGGRRGLQRRLEVILVDRLFFEVLLFQWRALSPSPVLSLDQFDLPTHGIGLRRRE